MPRLPRPSLVLPMLLAAALFPGTALAHGVGTSQIQLSVRRAHLDGDWQIHVRDARWALGLDTTLAGEAGFRDLRSHEAELRGLLGRKLTLRGNGRPCPLRIRPDSMEWHPRDQVVLLRLEADCGEEISRIELDDELLFDLDPSHRAYYLIDDARVVNVGAFRATIRHITLAVRQLHVPAAIAEFAGDGLRYLVSRFDHLLFLVALLLPAGMLRQGANWTPRGDPGATARDVLGRVAAFSAGHAAGLCLSFYGVVQLDGRTIETALALSVFAAGWNNVKPFLTGRVIAVAFGLAHGMAFTGALFNLSLPRDARWLAMVCFGAGVQIGLMVVASAALPLIQRLSSRSGYPRWVLGVGSLAIAWLGVIWALQRALGLELFRHS